MKHRPLLALYAENVRFTVRHCVFVGNFCDGRGGAVHLDRATGNFVNCAYAGNESRSRGGALGTLGSNVSLVNCAAWGNKAERGGAFNFNDTDAEITNGSIAGNCGTTNGGAIQGASNACLTICNTIIWVNCAGASTTTLGASVNLIGGAKADRSDSIIANIGGTDPDFIVRPNPFAAPSVQGNLDVNDGSPAIDRGDGSKNSERFDLACRPRVNGDDVDLGAYEHVEQADFYVDASATGTGTGLTWQNAFPTLQGALAVVPQGALIFIAEGVYYPDEGPGTTPNNRASTFLFDEGMVLRGGFPAGGGTRDIQAHRTILSGDIDENDVNLDGNFIAEDLDELLGNNAYHVVSLNEVTAPVILSGLTITAGTADNGTLDNGFVFNSPQIGGGILAFASNVRVEECRIISNRAFHHGGGAYLRGTTIEVVDCVFVNNQSNAGTNPGGGAIYSRSGSLRIEGCSFSENHHPQGAACVEISNEGIGTGTCEILDCQFTENTTGGGGETALAISSLNSATVVRCEIRGNGSSSSNGTIRCFRTASAVFRDCLIAGNRAAKGIEADGDSILSLINCTITENRIAEMVLGSTANGIPASSITVGNSVIVENESAVGINPRDSSLFRSHSLIDGFPGDGTGNLNGNAGLDARFVDPISWAFAPTLDGDYTLGEDSPLIDAGLDPSTSSTLDLPGNPRFVDGDGDGTPTVDVGAYENQTVPVPPTIRIMDVAVNPNNGHVSLTVDSNFGGLYTAQWSRTLLPNSWANSTTGTLSVGNNTITVPGTAYGWPAVNKVFCRVISP